MGRGTVKEAAGYMCVLCFTLHEYMCVRCNEGGERSERGALLHPEKGMDGP